MDVCAVAFGFIEVPADVVRDSFDEPSRRAFSSALPAVLLDDMDELVNDGTDGLAFEFLAIPCWVAFDAVAAGCSDALVGIHEVDAEGARRCEVLAGEHGDDEGIPLFHDGHEFLVRPLSEVGCISFKSD